MAETKRDIIKVLQEQILRLQGVKSSTDGAAVDFGLGEIPNSFPHQIFPVGAIHEFIGTNLEDAAATCGFISALLSVLMRNNGICIYISCQRKLFPASLAGFGLSPDRVVFIDLSLEKDVLWASEEALKCESLAAVVTELDQISFAQSRRLQLVVEKSGVSCFLIRRNADKLSSTTAIARWQIAAEPSKSVDGMPGLGFPRWKVDLLKVKNGQPGSWIMEYAAGQFHQVKETFIPQEEIRKVI